MSYSTDLTSGQRLILLSMPGDRIPTFRKYDIYAILNSILYVMKTGCPWSMLPERFPDWKTVYHHFRTLGEKGIPRDLLLALVEGKRCAVGDCPKPVTGVPDSESVRSGLIQSIKGIDGHKKIKGIKRQVITDIYGYPLAVTTTVANVHDSKGAISLIKTVHDRIPSLKEIKADSGYRGCNTVLKDMEIDIIIGCVKSNYGTSGFMPIDGR